MPLTLKITLRIKSVPVLQNLNHRQTFYTSKDKIGQKKGIIVLEKTGSYGVFSIRKDVGWKYVLLTSADDPCMVIVALEFWISMVNTG